MKALLPKLLPHFCYLCNSIIKTSVFPLLSKSAKIIPVHKSVNEYRPLAILRFLSKVFESILRDQMNQEYGIYGIYLENRHANKQLLQSKIFNSISMINCYTLV